MLSTRSHTLPLGNRNIKINGLERFKVTSTLIRSRRWQWGSRNGPVYPVNLFSVYVPDINMPVRILGDSGFYSPSRRGGFKNNWFHHRKHSSRGWCKNNWFHHRRHRTHFTPRLPRK
ncbi:hypothetical protein CsSME_00046324 [Camellia sinensis var. sinensis]